MGKYEDALNTIKESYDAFGMENKYVDDIDGTTHADQFNLLLELKGDEVENAIHWICSCYDCWYKNEYEDESNTAFGYLRELCVKADKGSN